eukprot:754162-Hanusia_phi.AAC.3
MQTGHVIVDCGNIRGRLSGGGHQRRRGVGYNVVTGRAVAAAATLSHTDIQLNRDRLTTLATDPTHDLAATEAGLIDCTVSAAAYFVSHALTDPDSLAETLTNHVPSTYKACWSIAVFRSQFPAFLLLVMHTFDDALKTFEIVDPRVRAFAELKFSHEVAAGGDGGSEWAVSEELLERVLA